MSTLSLPPLSTIDCSMNDTTPPKVERVNMEENIKQLKQWLSKNTMMGINRNIKTKFKRNDNNNKNDSYIQITPFNPKISGLSHAQQYII